MGRPRYALLVTAHHPVTGAIVLAACTQYGIRASTLTGNGMVFTTRFSGGKAQAAARPDSARATSRNTSRKPS
jgi:hypothetical protein